MQELETTDAAAVARNPSADQVCFFELALWGNPDSLNTILHDMRPAFSVGGFSCHPTAATRYSLSTPAWPCRRVADT